MTTPLGTTPKPAITSTTVIGALIALASTVMPVLEGIGLVPAGATPDFVKTLDLIGQVVGSITAIFGRFNAKQVISLTGK